MTIAGKQGSVVDAGAERIAAHRAGLSTFRVGPDKRPLVSEWRSYMEELPDDLDVMSEAHHGGCYAIVCGIVSSSLVVIDFEAGFRPRWKPLIESLDRAGLADTFANWCAGYTVWTPSGGIHVAVHLAGDVPGNTKLAFADGKVIAELRGQGGYVVGPGSNGAGEGWRWHNGNHSTIEWATPEEFAAVCEHIRRFDETPKPEVRVCPEPTFWDIGDSWIDRLPGVPMAQLLERYGWTLGRTEAEGTLVTRPGKDPRDGHSGRINHSDRLLVWSTNAEPVPASNHGRQTFDWVDVVGCYSFGYLPDQRQRVEIMRGFRPAVAHPGGEVGEAGGRSEVPPESSLYLPATFWQSREWLISLYQQSLDRLIPPEATLGCVLSTYATTLPMGIWVPEVVVARAPLNIYSAIVAKPGGGKTGAISLASDLVNYHDSDDVRLNRSLRSGQGLVNLATKKRPKTKGGEFTFDSPSYYQGVQVVFDEGATLSRQSEQTAAMALPYLTSAWSGSAVVGGAKAEEEGSFPSNLVRVCAIIGIQFGVGGNLFHGGSMNEGFPQRMLYFAADNPVIADPALVESYNAERVRPLSFPTYAHSEFTQHPQYLAVPPEIVHEVRTWHQAKSAGLDDPYDAHMMNLRLRIASVLSLTEGRFALTDQDWDLATAIESSSRAVRRALSASTARNPKSEGLIAGEREYYRQQGIELTRARELAPRLARHVANAADGLTRKEVRHLYKSSERRHIDSIIAYAVDRGWIALDGDRYVGGDSRPN